MEADSRGSSIDRPGKSDRSGLRWSTMVLPIVAFLIAFVMAVGVLYRGHPHEDAFILFKYANQLAAGNGIVYWPGGPHAEGATDFLWMMMLAAAKVVGCDVAVAAAFGNAIGAAILTWLCTREWKRWTWSNGVLRVLALVFLVSGPGLAAYGGFSALLYAAIAAWTFRRTLGALIGEGSAVSIPWLAIVLALFRPDGVILGVGFAAVGFVAARRNGELRRFLLPAGGALVVGIAYAVWRRAYFGLSLPLPLYVKSRTSTDGASLPGLATNLDWLTAWDGAMPLLAGIAVLVVIARPRRAELVAFVLCLAPALLHFVALAFARQTQNLGSRFEGPELAILFVSVFFWSARAGRVEAGKVPRWIACAVTVAALVPMFVVGKRTFERWSRVKFAYVDSFGVELGAILERDDVLALTEAGRLSYWTNARVEDVVGLNSPAIALHPVTVDALRELDPDVFLFYAGTFSIVLHIADKQPVVEIPVEMLSASVLPEYRVALQSEDPAVFDRILLEQRASLVLARFALESRAYDLYAVDLMGNYAHVYGIRKGHPARDELVSALRATASGRTSITYAQAAGLPWSTR